MFEQMEVEEQVYEGVTPSKITKHIADTNHSINDSKIKGVKDDSPTN